MRETKIGTIQSPLQADLDKIADGIVDSLGVDLALFSASYNNALVALGISGSFSRTEKGRFFDPADTICSSVIESDSPLIITDAKSDLLTCSNKYVQTGLVAGYVGIPIHNAEIGAIGALCGVTSEPRDWSEADLRYLEAVGQSVENLVLREMYRLESADASNLLSEYDQIIAAFSLVRADATSIHDRSGRLVFANKALMEHVSDDELQSRALTEKLLYGTSEDELRVSVETGKRFVVRRVRTNSGYLVCQWSLDGTMLN